MSIIHSHNNTLDSIFVNNTGNTVQSCEWPCFRALELEGDKNRLLTVIAQQIPMAPIPSSLQISDSTIGRSTTVMIAFL